MEITGSDEMFDVVGRDPKAITYWPTNGHSGFTTSRLLPDGNLSYFCQVYQLQHDLPPFAPNMDGIKS
jgi:hypothetical protein